MGAEKIMNFENWLKKAGVPTTLCNVYINVMLYDWSITDWQKNFWENFLKKTIKLLHPKISFLYIFQYTYLTLTSNLQPLHTICSKRGPDNTRASICKRLRSPGIDSSRLFNLSPNFWAFGEPKNRFQGTNSARLCSLAVWRAGTKTLSQLSS